MISRSLFSFIVFFAVSCFQASATDHVPFSRPEQIVELFRRIINVTNAGAFLNYETEKQSLQWAMKYLTTEAKSLDPVSATPPAIELQCGHLDFSRALKGGPSIKPKYIIDVVPFGFDADYLDIRLNEAYDIVDKFIIVEQDMNHKGVPKPVMVPELLKMDRFRPFLDKIDYIQDHLDPNERYMLSKFNIWQIEKRMRSLPILYLQKTLFTGENPPDPNNVYVIQNDGDEMINRRALFHFKHCESIEVYPIYAPCLCFKKNTAWLLNTTTLSNFPIANQTFEALRTTLWGQGPFIWSWHHVSAYKNTRRAGLRDNNPNLGLGSSVHLSDPTHVVNHFLKLMSAPELKHREFLPQILRRIHQGQVTMEAIESNLYRCFTRAHETSKTLHTSYFGPEAQKFIDEILPWAMKIKEYRYPWLYTDVITEHEANLHRKYCPSAE